MNEIKTPNGLMTAIPTGIEARRYNGIDTVELKKAPGYLVSPDGKVTEWFIEKFLELDGTMAAVGPRLGDSKAWNPDNDGPEIPLKILVCVGALASAGYPQSGLYLPSIQLLSDGSFFFVPPKLSSWMRDNSPDKSLDRDWNAWTHPDLQGEDGWSFSFGMIAWSLLTKTDPYAGETGELRRERIRNNVVPSIAIDDGKLEDDAISIIDNSLAPEKERRSLLSDWERLFRLWNDEGVHKEISEEEAEVRSAKARRLFVRKDKQLRGKRWIRKSLWKYLLGGAILGSILAIASAPISKALEIPVTVGMSPQEVAITYYQGIDSLNSEIMDDCLARKVGKQDRQHVDMIFVTNKVRQGYEGISAPPRAEDWLAEGKPELPEGVWPWGITNLELKQVGATTTIAQYKFWFPQEGTDITKAFGERREDTLEFTEGRHSWEISSIQREILPRD